MYGNGLRSFYLTDIITKRNELITGGDKIGRQDNSFRAEPAAWHGIR